MYRRSGRLIDRRRLKESGVYSRYCNEQDKTDTVCFRRKSSPSVFFHSLSLLRILCRKNIADILSTVIKKITSVGYFELDIDKMQTTPVNQAKNYFAIS